MGCTRYKLMHSIYRTEASIEAKKIMLDTIEKFKHYKKVNKRFADSLETKGCSVWITKYNYYTVLRVFFPHPKYKLSGEIHLSFQGVGYGEITWDLILEKLHSLDLENNLEETKKDLEAFDDEIRKAETLLEIINSNKFRCFDVLISCGQLARDVDLAKKCTMQIEERENCI